MDWRCLVWRGNSTGEEVYALVTDGEGLFDLVAGYLRSIQVSVAINVRAH